MIDGEFRESLYELVKPFAYLVSRDAANDKLAFQFEFFPELFLYPAEACKYRCQPQDESYPARQRA